MQTRVVAWKVPCKAPYKALSKALSKLYRRVVGLVDLHQDMFYSEAMEQLITLQLRTCEPCQRDFIPTPGGCLEHCGPACCRVRPCENAKPPTRNPKGKARTCVVCHRDNLRFKFERFAECDEGCSRVRFNGRQGINHAGQMRVWYCLGVLADAPGRLAFHHPAHHKPRVHIKYCSLTCWGSVTYGHEAHKRTGRARRAGRYWNKYASRSAYLAEIHRQEERDIANLSQADRLMLARIEAGLDNRGRKPGQRRPTVMQRVMDARARAMDLKSGARDWSDHVNQPWPRI